MKQYLEIGEIVTTHGIKGDLRMYPWCDDGDLVKIKTIYWDENGIEKSDISYIKPHKNVYLLKIKGVDIPEEGRKYIGKTVFANRKDIPIKKGEYFIEDLIGLKVLDYEDNNICYGTLNDVAQTGANDIYSVKDCEGKETWIPAIPDVVKKTDVESGIMYITAMKGLFDDED